jgi:beta-N-acetylhexosaminidase
LETERPAMIIAATQNAGVNRGQAEIIRALQERKQPLVVVALRNPYDLSAFPDLDTYIAAYGCQRVTLEAVAKLLWGRISPRGKLPVSLPGLYPAGFGMEDF